MRFAIGVGTRRAGTSTVHRLLSQDPAVQKPTGGLHYFSSESYRHEDLDAYRSQFGPDDTRLAVDLSVSYSYPENAEVVANRMAALFADTAEQPIVFALVRDPVTRCISDYHRSVMLGDLPAGTTIEQAIAADPDLVTRGLAAQNLTPFRDAFGENFTVLLYEDLRERPDHFYAELNALLGTSIDGSADVQVGPSKTYRRPAVVSAVNSARKLVDRVGVPEPLRKPLGRLGRLARNRLEETPDEIDPATRRRLIEACRDDADLFAANIGVEVDLRERWSAVFDEVDDA